MFIYNVTIKITPAIEDQWLQWMQEEHMDEVISTGLFDSYQFYRLVEPQDDDGLTYVVQYLTEKEENYHNYINQYSQALRDKGYAKFGHQFIAFRTVLKRIS